MSGTPRRIQERVHIRAQYSDETPLLHELDPYREETRVQIEQLIDAQKLLQSERDYFAELYDAAPVALLTLDEHGVVRGLNRTARKLFNCKDQALVGFPFLRFVASSYRRKWLDLIGRSAPAMSNCCELFLDLNENLVRVELVVSSSCRNAVHGFCLALLARDNHVEPPPVTYQANHDGETTASENTMRATSVDGAAASASLDLHNLERHAVLAALDQHSGNRRMAANSLGISLRTLQRKLKVWGLCRR